MQNHIAEECKISRLDRYGAVHTESDDTCLGRYGAVPTGSDVVHLGHGGAVSTGWGRLLTLLRWGLATR